LISGLAHQVAALGEEIHPIPLGPQQTFCVYLPSTEQVASFLSEVRVWRYERHVHWRLRVVQVLTLLFYAVYQLNRLLRLFGQVSIILIYFCSRLNAAADVAEEVLNLGAQDDVLAHLDAGALGMHVAHDGLEQEALALVLEGVQRRVVVQGRLDGGAAPYLVKLFPVGKELLVDFHSRLVVLLHCLLHVLGQALLVI
ncbi:hypothetical protein EGW08_006223, partial [Elysia chlorotica]